MYNEEDSKKVKKTSKKRKKAKFFFFPFVRESDSKLEKTFAKLLKNDLYLTFLFIIIGIIFNFRVELNIISLICSVLFLAYGIVEFLYFMKRNAISLFKENLIYSIGSFLIGVFTIINTFTKTLTLNKLVAIWFIYMGLLHLVKAFKLNSLDKKSFTMMLVTSLSTFFLAVILFINPFKNLLENQVIGVYLILYGLLHANIIVLLRAQARRILKNINN